MKLTKKQRGRDKLKELPAIEDDPAWKILDNPKHWGVRDSSKRIDEFVYGPSY